MKHSRNNRYGTLSRTDFASVFGSYPFGMYPIWVRNRRATSSRSFSGVRGVLLTTAISNGAKGGTRLGIRY